MLLLPILPNPVESECQSTHGIHSMYVLYIFNLPGPPGSHRPVANKSPRKSVSLSRRAELAAMEPMCSKVDLPRRRLFSKTTGYHFWERSLI